jgi:hypothetical protein
MSMPGRPDYISNRGTPIRDVSPDMQYNRATDETDGCTLGRYQKQSTITDTGSSLIPLGDQGNRFASAGLFKGEIYVSIRDYFWSKHAENWYPTKHGINLNVHQWEYLKSNISKIDELVNQYCDTVDATHEFTQLK